MEYGIIDEVISVRK